MAYDLKIFTDNIEPSAVNQIYNMLAQPPFRDSKVRIMPDVHSGNGCVVGFTANLNGKVSPNTIGVDIGCGMLTVRLGKIKVDLKALDGFIRENIPSGGSLRKYYSEEQFIQRLRCFHELRDLDRIYRSLGTLGGGNHFIELDSDGDGELYLVIHTGSRNLGLQVAKLYQKKAIEACKNAAETEKKAAHDKLLSEGRAGELPEAFKRIAEKYASRT